MRTIAVLAMVALGCGAAVDGPEQEPVVSGPRIRAIHVHFGVPGEERPLVAGRLRAAFLRATGGQADVEISEGPTLWFPRTEDAPEYASVRQRFANLQPADVARVWYYEGGYERLLRDLRAQVQELAKRAPDVILVTTSAQLDGRGFFFGGLAAPVIVVESLSLGAWARQPTYVRIPVAGAELADVGTHELGHFFGLGHACGQCAQGDAACCDRCPDREGVMSHCRESAADAAPHLFSDQERARIQERMESTVGSAGAFGTP